jgi:hypothetical protein
VPESTQRAMQTCAVCNEKGFPYQTTVRRSSPLALPPPSRATSYPTTLPALAAPAQRRPLVPLQPPREHLLGVEGLGGEGQIVPPLRLRASEAQLRVLRGVRQAAVSPRFPPRARQGSPRRPLRLRRQRQRQRRGRRGGRQRGGKRGR